MTKTMLVRNEKGNPVQSPHFEEVADRLYRVLNYGTPDAKTELDGKTGNITSEHISEGECGSSEYCALALAVRDMFAVLPEQIEVDGFRASIYDASLRNAIDLELSQPLQDWIDAFDSENEVKPVRLIVLDEINGDCVLDILHTL